MTDGFVHELLTGHLDRARMTASIRDEHLQCYRTNPSRAFDDELERFAARVIESVGA